MPSRLMPSRRCGISLLEVLVATVILMVALAALSSQALVGVRAANGAQLQAMAAVLCRSILEEQSALSRPVSSTLAVPGHRGWVASTRFEPISDTMSTLDRSSQEQVYRLSVSVWQSGRSELISKVTLSKFVCTSATKSIEPIRDTKKANQ